jgi:predicted outer membrane repeat protein/parallel beta-helix repeat protein
MTPGVEAFRFPAARLAQKSRTRQGLTLGLLLLAIASRGSAVAQTGPGYALKFDGASGYVQLQNFLSSAPTNEVTVEFWQKVHDFRPQSTFCQSPPPAGSTASNSVFNAHVPFADGQVYWDFGNITQGGRLSYLPPIPITNSWQHFAFVASQNGNYMAIYRNGILEAFKSGMTPLVPANLDLNLSGVPTGFPYRGQLDEFRIWRVARSQDDIMQNMFHAMTGTEANLAICLHFNEGGGPVTQDATGSALNIGILNGGVSWLHSTAPFVPEVSPLAAVVTSASNAVLNVRVNPDSLPTSARFEWGPTMSMGNQTALMDVGSNSMPTLLSLNITDLNPGTIYYYRADAFNQGGIEYGYVLPLMTPSAGTTNNLNTTNLSDNAGDPVSIRALLNNAVFGQSITIPPLLTGSILLSNGPLTIATDLMITGNCNAVIDGLGQYQAFTPITNTVTINELIFSNCFGANGGAINVASGGSLTLNYCTFINNSASNLGGAICVSNSGTIVLNNCTLVQNLGTNGGAIDTFGSATLFTCTVVSNTASGNGGGLRLETSGGSSLAVNNCTIAGNRAFSGGGIEDDEGSLTMQNSIVANNALTGGSGPDVHNSVMGFNSSGYNLISQDNGSSGWKHSGSPDDDLRGSLGNPLNPLLARLDNYGGCPLTMELLPGSPAIDTGSSCGQTNDERGFLRPTNILGNVSPPGDSGDIGAFEVQPFDLTNAPVLTILPSGTNAILLWDMLAKAYTLEQSTSLVRVPSWTPVPVAPVPTNGGTQLTVTQIATNRVRLYRLRAP